MHMNKRNIVIYILIFSILVIISFDILLVLQNSENSLLDTENATGNEGETSLSATYQYNCVYEPIYWSGIMNETDVSFSYQRGYEFTWNKLGVKDGHITVKITFENQESYDTYDLTNMNTSEELNLEVLDEENLIKKYSYYAIWSSEDNDLENYLNTLEEEGMVCEKMQ